MRAHTNSGPKGVIADHHTWQLDHRASFSVWQLLNPGPRPVRHPTATTVAVSQSYQPLNQKEEIKAPQPFSRWFFCLKKTWNFWCAILRALQRHHNSFSIKTSHIRLTWKHTVNQSIWKKEKEKKKTVFGFKRFQSCSITQAICPCQSAAIRLHLKDVWRCPSEPTAEVNAMQCGLNADNNNQHLFLWHKPNDLYKPTHLQSLPSANVLSTTATMWGLDKTKTQIHISAKHQSGWSAGNWHHIWE